MLVTAASGMTAQNTATEHADTRMGEERASEGVWGQEEVFRGEQKCGVEWKTFQLQYEGVRVEW